MSDKEKDFTPDKETEVTSTKTDKAAVLDEKEASKKIAKAVKGKKAKKNPDGNIVKRGGKSAKRFFKDFKGETKKIVWPDAKTVLKSTGVVILVVAICTLAIFGIDWVFTKGVEGLKYLATGETTTIVDESTSAGDTTAADDTTAEGDTTAEADTTAESETTTGEAETTAAQDTTAEAQTTAAEAE